MQLEEQKILEEAGWGYYSKCAAAAAKSCRTLSDPMDCSLPGPLSMGFSRQEYWSGVIASVA